jgi:methyl-accepting chemotaxis protein
MPKRFDTMISRLDSKAINRRFAIVTTLILLLVLALVGISSWNSIQSNNFIETIEEDQIPEVLNISGAVEKIQAAEASLYAALLSANPSKIETLLNGTRTNLEDAQKRIDKYTSGTHPASEQELIQDLKQKTETWSNTMQDLMKLAQANTGVADQQAATLLEQEIDDAIIEDLQKVIEINQDEINETRTQAGSNFQTAMLGTVGFALAVMVLIFSALWLLSRSIININRDVRRLNEEAKQALSENNRRFGESASIRLKSIIGQLSATTTQQTANADQQTSAVAEVTSSLAELGETSRQIATNSKQVNAAALETLANAGYVKQIAGLASDNAEAGQMAVSSAIGAIEEVRDGITGLAQRLLALTERSKQINSIINLIKNIADETHLLALNAAIESAGAGESGRRFGVVAAEVKSLADRSLEATEEVSQVINELQGAVAAAVLASEETRKRTYGAVERSIQAGRTITELGQVVESTAQSATGIEEMVKKVALLSEEISLATQQQNSAVRQLISTMEGIKDVTQENASSITQIGATVSQIDQLSDQIKEALSGSNREALAA